MTETTATPGSTNGWTAVVERDDERELIDGALAGAELGQGRVVLLYGPSGVGTSTLLRATAMDAESRGFDVLHASGSELERGYGFGVVRQLLEARIAGMTTAQRLSMIGDAGPRPSRRWESGRLSDVSPARALSRSKACIDSSRVWRPSSR